MLVSWQHLGVYAGVMATLYAGVVAALGGICWCHGNT